MRLPPRPALRLRQNLRMLLQEAPPAFALAKIQPPRSRTALVERQALEQRARPGAAAAQADAAAGAGRLRQDRGADAADPPAARRLRAGLDQRRRRRPAAALPGLPDGRARTLRPALARRARGAGHAGAGRAWLGRRGRRTGQRAGRGRGVARADRRRRPAPHQRPAGLRAAAQDAGTLARTLGPGAGQPHRATAAAGAAARCRRTGRDRPAPAALQPGRGGRAAGPERAARRCRAHAQPAAAHARLGGGAAPQPGGRRRAGTARQRHPAPLVRLPGQRGAGRHARSAAGLPAALLGAARAQRGALCPAQRRCAGGAAARRGGAPRPVRQRARHRAADLAAARPVPRLPRRPAAAPAPRRGAGAAASGLPNTNPTWRGPSVSWRAPAPGTRRCARWRSAAPSCWRWAAARGWSRCCRSCRRRSSSATPTCTCCAGCWPSAATTGTRCTRPCNARPRATRRPAARATRPWPAPMPAPACTTWGSSKRPANSCRPCAHCRWTTRRGPSSSTSAPGTPSAGERSDDVMAMVAQMLDCLERIPDVRLWLQCANLSLLVGLPGMAPLLDRFAHGVARVAGQAPSQLRAAMWHVRAGQAIGTGRLDEAWDFLQRADEDCHWLGKPRLLMTDNGLTHVLLHALRGEGEASLRHGLQVHQDMMQNGAPSHRRVHLSDMLAARARAAWLLGDEPRTAPRRSAAARSGPPLGMGVGGALPRLEPRLRRAARRPARRRAATARADGPRHRALPLLRRCAGAHHAGRHPPAPGRCRRRRRPAAPLAGPGGTRRRCRRCAVCRRRRAAAAGRRAVGRAAATRAVPAAAQPARAARGARARSTRAGRARARRLPRWRH